MYRKALLVPYNSKGEIFIQDRTDYKPPPWGLFGGSIEEGETPLEAVIRETKEELDLDIAANDLVYMGQLDMVYEKVHCERYFYLYKTNQAEFTVLEGAGGEWASFAEVGSLFKKEDNLEGIIQLIEKFS